MSISPLQREAFVNNGTFNAQVNGHVTTYALYQNDQVANQTDEMRRILVDVSNNPGSKGFASTIVSDAAWSTTFDAWASDPAAQDAALEAAVGHHFYFLTGWQPPTPAAPPPA
jgi:hypothetical protein